MRKRRILALISVPAILLAMLAVALSPAPAQAHGAMLKPGARTYFCWLDGLTPQGNIQNINPACSAAVAQSGDNSLYNWFGVLRSDGAGRTRGFIPDGQLCSGGNPQYLGFDVARNDFPVTHLTSGASFNWSYNAWANHPGWFFLYVTKDTWSPTRPLTWDDLEDEPFLTIDHPPVVGSPGTVETHYPWTGNLPAGKSGRHIIYSVWKRSDSNETFYGCSDVVFDGGNGQVTGLGRTGGTTSTSPTTSTSTTTTTTIPGQTTTTGGATTTTTGTPGACRVRYEIQSTWQNGFVAQVTVTNTGSSTINGWSLRWTFNNNAQVTNIWNAANAQSGANMTASNIGWNAQIAPGAARDFGFQASHSNGAPLVPASFSLNNTTCAIG